MNYHKREEHGAQRSAFGRLMAARRASDGPSASSTTTMARTVAASGRGTTPAVRLPTIGKGSGMATVSASLTSTPQLFTNNNSCQRHNGSSSSPTSSSTNQSSGLGSGPTAAASTAALSPFVINERTPRAELLAIIARLQVDLSQRTDSVNAIQRNFQRLSAMHHAEQDELERLRGLQQQWQDVIHKNNSNGAKLTEQQQLIEQIRGELERCQEQYTRLEEETANLQRGHQQALELNGTVQLHFNERKRIEFVEAAEYAALAKEAAVEQTRLSAEAKREEEQKQFRAELLRLLHAHTAQLATSAMGDDVGKSKELTSPDAALVRNTNLPALFHEDADSLRSVVAVELQKACDVVKKCVEARDTAASQRHTASTAAAQQVLEDMGAKAADLQQALRETLLQCEEEERRSLEDAALSFIAESANCYQRTSIFLEENSRLMSEAQAQLSDARIEFSKRVDQWVGSADNELHAFRSHIDAYCAQIEGDVAAQRALLNQHEQEASELAAVRAEWAALRDTELKAHRAELARVRQDAAGKMATIELRLNAAQQQCLKLQQELEDTRVASQQETAEAEKSLQEKVKAAVTEREALLSRQWYRVQSAQEAYSAQVMELLWSVFITRGECCEEEATARVKLCHNYVQTTGQLTQCVGNVKAQAGAMQALWNSRVQHAMEDETAARLLLKANAEKAFALMTYEETSERHLTQHTKEVTQFLDKLHNAESRVRDVEALYRSRAEQLAADLRSAQEQLRAAQDRAWDANAAALAARQAEQKASDELREFKTATAAAAQRIEVTESATESACCCPICLQLLYNPVACVPCGHVYCAACLLYHKRNKLLSAMTDSAATTGATDAVQTCHTSTFGTARVEVEVSQWMRSLIAPQTRLFCPECGMASVSTLVELRSLGELAAKYSYKKGAVMELIRCLS